MGVKGWGLAPAPPLRIMGKGKNSYIGIINTSSIPDYE